jgi:uncharacterized protein YndB with AHSA1/START domain
MPPSNRIFKFEKLVEASPALVYEAFTNATSLQEWLCDFATIDPKIGGRIYLYWNSGFYSAGEYTELKPNERIVFTWDGRGEPAATQIEVKLKRKKSATLVQLSHQRLGTSAKWENVRREVQEGWTSSLENLASVLKTGEDLRFLRRPMVGIGLSDFNEEIASHLNVPVTKGIRIDTVVDGMGAQAAGLQGNDVIVRMAGQDITDWSSLNNVLESHHAGDKIEVVFYRGADQKTVVMELSRRPLPELAQDVPALAKVSRKRQDTIQAEMDEFFKDVSEKEASFKPAPDEWSAKEVLAHLIQGERYYQIWITELAGRQEGHHDDWTGNLQAPIDATLAAYPSLADMRQEYKRSCNETVALIANLPKEFQTHKGSFWRLAYSEADSPYHHRIHMEQMGAAIAAARNASK